MLRLLYRFVNFNRRTGSRSSVHELPARPHLGARRSSVVLPKLQVSDNALIEWPSAAVPRRETLDRLGMFRNSVNSDLLTILPSGTNLNPDRL